MNNTPPDLARIQRWMQSVITHPDGVAAGIASGEARAAIDVDVDKVEGVIRRSEAMTSVERLQIYGNAYYARLLECMRDEYPALVHAVGKEGFDGFAFGYLQTYPSTSYTLALLGANFPRYLQETRPPRQDGEFGPDWADFLIDLARLERTYAEVFDGPGTEGKRLLQPEDLCKIPPHQWPSIRLVPVESLRLMTFQFAVHEYASSVRRKETPLPLEAQTTWLAITRRDFVVRRVPLSAIQFGLLSAICEGRALGEAVEAAADVSNSSTDELAQSLRAWFEEWSAARFFERVE